MYFSYHNVIKKKLNEGKLLKIEYVNNYKNLGKVFIIYFNDGKKYPIREYAWKIYEKYFY